MILNSSNQNFIPEQIHHSPVLRNSTKFGELALALVIINSQEGQVASSYFIYLPGSFKTKFIFTIFQNTIISTNAIHNPIGAFFRLLWVWYILKCKIHKFKRENLSRVVYKDQVKPHQVQWWMLMLTHFRDNKKYYSFLLLKYPILLTIENTIKLVH